jgi:hypothetical protein
MDGTRDELMPVGSGNLANALDGLAGFDDDDFLTGDDVTIAQIHSLACKSHSYSHPTTVSTPFYTFSFTRIHN